VPHEVSFHKTEEKLPYVFTNCYTCGERIYLLEERMNALKKNYKTFYCSQGHNQAFVKPNS
jgi:hypothetical protein